jgi:dephospho-CoA kinase
MLRVGLTGGIASGKSHVRRRLQAAGMATLDLDEVAHRVTAPGGSAHAEVAAAFGPGVLAADGTLDRKALGAIVFGDPAALARLNALVHPRVREEEERAAAAWPGDPGAVLVTDAALLVEAGAHLRFDRLVVVYCPAAEQQRRLQGRDGLDEAAARARLAAQMDPEEKRRFAHYVLDSRGSHEVTDREVDALVPELRALARQARAAAPAAPERARGCLARGPAQAAEGLATHTLLAALAGAPQLEMEALREALRPGRPRPWYRAGRPEPADPAHPPPAAAMAPLVLWTLARRGPDRDWLASAAASLARLFHSAPAALAGAVHFALALEAVARGGIEALLPRLAEHGDLAARWGGAPPEPRVLEAVRAAAAGEGPPGTLAGALVGLAQGAPAAAVPAELRAALQSLER